MSPVVWMDARFRESLQRIKDRSLLDALHRALVRLDEYRAMSAGLASRVRAQRRELKALHAVRGRERFRLRRLEAMLDAMTVREVHDVMRRVWEKEGATP